MMIYVRGFGGWRGGIDTQIILILMSNCFTPLKKRKWNVNNARGFLSLSLSLFLSPFPSLFVLEYCTINLNYSKLSGLKHKLKLWKRGKERWWQEKQTITANVTEFWILILWVKSRMNLEMKLIVFIQCPQKSPQMDMDSKSAKSISNPQVDIDWTWPWHQRMEAINSLN